MISPKFLALLDEEDLKDRAVLDVGCGTGRLTRLLALRARRAIGIDRNEAVIAEACQRARAAGLGNVEFRVADAEVAEYHEFGPQMVVAHLCVSDAIIERAGRVLAPGERLAFVAFHADQWRETGVPSRFAYEEARLASVLEANGFVAECLAVDRQVTRFGSAEEGLAAVSGLRERWQVNGRWERYMEFLTAGGRTLTQSHLAVKARRR